MVTVRRPDPTYHLIATAVADHCRNPERRSLTSRELAIGLLRIMYDTERENVQSPDRVPS